MPSVYKEPRKTIAVNLDDTLSHTLEALSDWHNLCYGTHHTMTDMDCYIYMTFGVAHRKTLVTRSVNSINPIILLPLNPSWILPWKHSRCSRNDGSICHHHFTTTIHCRGNQTVCRQALSSAGLNFTIGIFESIYFCNLGLSDEEQLEYISKRKATICHEIGVDVLIDHQLEHCVECAQAGVDVLLYDRKGQYKWNHQQLSTPNIHRVTTWRDIIQRHFPKPNSPLRHLVYPYSEEDDMTCDNQDDQDDTSLDHDDDDWDMMVV
ncbi:unnamed protein product [Absidia cylindrospora]